VLSNRLTAWSLASLATGHPQVDCVISLDAPPLGAGDPSDVVAIDGGTLVVALAGVHQLAVVDVAQQRVTSRIAIGRRPLRLVRTAPDQLAVLLAGEQAVVSVSLPAGELRWRTDVGAHAVSTPQRRGEDAFFDAHLSAGGFLSCHSCHTDGHTHGLLADTFNDGSHGTPKRTPTLRGTALTYRWAWNGQFQNLHDQVRVSFLETQHAPELEETTVLDVVSFLHTLPFTRPRRTTATSRADERLQSRGQQLFERLQCTQCHIPPVIYAAHEMFDVGLADERGLVKFNPPSLRGIGHQRRFFHDNRAGSLADVFREFAHPGATRLTEDDLAALVRFLESL
jgi:cytochrome c peroxidase